MSPDSSCRTIQDELSFAIFHVTVGVWEYVHHDSARRFTTGVLNASFRPETNSLAGALRLG